MYCVNVTVYQVWYEDLRMDSILTMDPSSSRLTAAAWAPTRLSMFLTANTGGFLEIRDYLVSHAAPFLQIKIADYPLHSIKVTVSCYMD